MEGSVVACAFGTEKAGGVIQRRQVPSRGIDPCLIGVNRRCDLIPFTAQGGGEVHPFKLEHNRNSVKTNSESPKGDPVPKSRKNEGILGPDMLRSSLGDASHAYRETWPPAEEFHGT
jgi:hypothetical protein